MQDMLLGGITVAYASNILLGREFISMEGRVILFLFFTLEKTLLGEFLRIAPLV